MNQNITLFIFITLSTIGVLISAFFLLYGFCLTRPDFSVTNDIQISEMIYRSHLDGVFPLHALVCYQKKSNMPIAVLMHEYSIRNDRYSLLETAIRFAQRGFFVIVPDMRGRGKYAELNLVQYNVRHLSVFKTINRLLLRLCSLVARYNFFIKKSAGKRDSSGREIHDIYDSVEAAKVKYNYFIDPENVNIVGYSGGGGNAIAAVAKSPNYFNVAAIYFGISDYKKWYETTNDPTIRKQLIYDIGGTPEERPDHYLARNFLLSAGNNCTTSIYLFVDEDDRLTPVYQTKSYHEKACNSKIYLSTRNDCDRYFHANPAENTNIVYTEKEYFSEMYKKKEACKIVQNKYIVNGFMFNKDYTILMGSGENTLFEIEWGEEQKKNIFQITIIAGRKKGLIIFHGVKEQTVYQNDIQIKSSTDQTYEKIFEISAGIKYRIMK